MTTPTKLQTTTFVLLSCLAMVTAGCGGGAAQRIESSDNLRHLVRAVMKYHDDNSAYPEKLADLEALIGQDDLLGTIGDGKDYATLITNPITGANPGYEYVKPPEDPESSSTIVFYQLIDGKRDGSLPAAYLDGSVK